MDNSEVEFEIKTEEVDPLCELTTQENKLAIREDDSEVSVEFKIKSEELIIKDEVDDATFGLTTTKVNNDLSEKQRQFVIIKSESGPSYHIIDTLANIVIKGNESISTKEDLIGILTCNVKSVKLSTSKMQERDEEQAVNEFHIVLPSKATNYQCNVCSKCFPGKRNLKRHIMKVKRLTNVNCVRKLSYLKATSKSTA